jgi:mRNA-degrading endonuclease toxin of MazEF toxin-antitoxin module
MDVLRRTTSRAAACGILAVAVTAVRDARAELHEAVERIAEAWRGVGAAVALDKTRFLTDDNDDQRPVVIALPDLPEGECTTVVLLGARGLGFHVRLPPNTGGDELQGKRLPSVAGALSIEVCGDSPPRRLVLASDSGRGAIETVVARSSKPLPSLRSVLPERASGALMPMSEPGPLPVLPSPEKRAEVAELRAKRDGAAIATRETWQSAVDGTGGGQRTLDPGCHTLRLFALDPRAAHPNRRGKLDLDAEMHDESDDRLLARDRTDAPDVQLDVCVGETTRVDIVFAGSPPSAPVLLAHFAWPLPGHLPTLWGPEARARMAHVLLARHVASLPSEPVMLAQGVSGLTPIPLSIQPGACYLAVITRAKETARTIGLRVHVGSTDAFDDRGIDADGAAVAFCAGRQAHAIAEVEARGAPLLGWGFALYRLQSGVWEVPQ